MVYCAWNLFKFWYPNDSPDIDLKEIGEYWFPTWCLGLLWSKVATCVSQWEIIRTCTQNHCEEVPGNGKQQGKIKVTLFFRITCSLWILLSHIDSYSFLRALELHQSDAGHLLRICRIFDRISARRVNNRVAHKKDNVVGMQKTIPLCRFRHHTCKQWCKCI